MISEEDISVKKRIQELLVEMGAKYADLAESESDRVMLGRQINDEKTIVPYRTLYRLLKKYPSVSADWLIMGVGSMNKSDNASGNVYHNEVNGSTAGGDINVGTNLSKGAMQAKIEDQAARIHELERDKYFLQTLLDSVMTKKRNV